MSAPKSSPPVIELHPESVKNIDLLCQLFALLDRRTSISPTKRRKVKYAKTLCNLRDPNVVYEQAIENGTRCQFDRTFASPDTANQVRRYRKHTKS